PLLASAHESSCIRLWSIQGNLMKELLPFSEHPSGPLTTLCTDIFTKILLTGSKNGHIIRWNIASFLEDSQNKKNVRKYLSDPLNLNSIPRQTKKINSELYRDKNFELSDISRLILPSDVNNFPAIIKEESKHMEKKKVKYPLMLDRDK
ncbi:WDR64 protein, partial [Mystacornis crossleyi]|nr:WDR64 protein [Mystacornis crossleyi]